METNVKERVSEHRPMRIFVSSPYRPTLEDENERKMQLSGNIHRAVRACKLVSIFGAIPLCPHIYFTRFCDDAVPEERERGMKMAEDWLAQSDELWAFTGASNTLSEGMLKEVNLAKELGITARIFRDPDDLIDTYLISMDGEDEDAEDENGGATDGVESEEDHE